MEPWLQRFELRVEYPVYRTTGVFGPGNPVLPAVFGRDREDAAARVLAVVDAGLVRCRPGVVAEIERCFDGLSPRAGLAGRPVVVPGGEAVKNDRSHLDALYGVVADLGLCRHSYVLAIGGGAVLDLAGYAAATAHRGLRLIRVPTTVLAQADSGVGVKNGVNFRGKKNFIGSFAAPYAVIRDSRFLQTLSSRDWLAGVAEAVKVAIVRDPSLFREIEDLASRLVLRDAAAMDRVIDRAAAAHLMHIAQGGDPFEFQSGRPLDFGHWVAHRLEQITGNRLRHGEAVAIGMAVDASYARWAGLLPEAPWRRIIGLLADLRFDLYVPELGRNLDDPAHPDGILGGLADFREHLGGRLAVTLPRDIGRTFETSDMDAAGIRSAIEALRRFQAGREKGDATCEPA